MNANIFYITSIVITGSAFFFLWQFGIKPLMLDDFRDSLFEVRDRLYRLSQEGRLECDSEAYRAVEAFINRTIRFAHRFTFLSFVFFAMSVDSGEESTSPSPYSQLSSQISTIDNKPVQQELFAIVHDVLALLPKYIGKSSIMFILGSMVYFIFHSASPFIARTKQLAVETFEVEAYREANFINGVRA